MTPCRTVRARLRIGDSIFVLADEFPPWGLAFCAIDGRIGHGAAHLPRRRRLRLRPCPKAGATVEMPVADMFWELAHRFRRKGSIGPHRKDVSGEEMESAVNPMFNRACTRQWRSGAGKAFCCARKRRLPPPFDSRRVSVHEVPSTSVILQIGRYYTTITVSFPLPC